MPPLPSPQPYGTQAHTNIRKVERIIEEFQSTLDDKYPVSKDFNNVYTYLHRRLVEANIKKDKEILEEVLELLRTMRDAWKEVMYHKSPTEIIESF